MLRLQLSLLRKWFEMTKSGVKKEDYREITPYWANRLIKGGNLEYWEGKLDKTGNELITGFFEKFKTEIETRYGGFKDFTVNKMTLGYPSKEDQEKIINLKHKGIEIRMGNPEWGAEEGKFYFVIKHGELCSENFISEFSVFDPEEVK